jgi:amino acid transporter
MSDSGQEVSNEGIGHGFGTAPVFLATVATILGAILFLRLGYAVANVGLAGALLIIFIGHLVTIPTALAIAEIATNRRVEGGGAYFIISRSFGTTIGGSIGVALYFSQALSIAFYMIAFAEAFQPLGPYFERLTGYVFDPRFISIPSTLLIAILVVVRGASIGMKALWVVVGTLALSLSFFFLGSPLEGSSESGLFETIPDGDPFILVFAIVFPAFTGMLAGVGLSGDLSNPRRAIPFGILSATGVGLAIYVATVIKLAASASPADLAADQLLMSRIAIWGPIIPIGLACATLSSAIGSILVAPRTLQALAADGIVPVDRVNRVLAEGIGKVNEPRAASIVTSVLAIATVAAGNIDFVARIISMFFMVTYGALCAISFLEHFAARPSYRPSFRSKWYLSLMGAVVCLLLMFQMDPFYAILAILVMIAIYRGIRSGRAGVDDLAAIFQGVMTQATRYFQVRLQKERMRVLTDEWRPSIIMVDGKSFSRSAPFQFLAWLCQRYGFGTYLHYIQGRLNEETFRQSRVVLKRLIDQTEALQSSVYVDTIVSPSLQTALAQSLQVPGVSGMENNTALFEFSAHDPPEATAEVADGCMLADAARMNALVLRHGDHFFGGRSRIHIWLTWHDYKNASLMILLAYILLGHRDWDDAEIRIFAAFPYEEVAEQRDRLSEMMVSGRLPISEKNLRIIPTDDKVDFHTLVERRSSSADLVILGFTEDRLREKGAELFLRHPGLRDVLFVSAHQRILIE